MPTARSEQPHMTLGPPGTKVANRPNRVGASGLKTNERLCPLLPHRFARSTEERRPASAWRQCSHATPAAISPQMLRIDRGRISVRRRHAGADAGMICATPCGPSLDEIGREIGRKVGRTDAWGTLPPGKTPNFIGGIWSRGFILTVSANIERGQARNLLTASIRIVLRQPQNLLTARPLSACRAGHGCCDLLASSGTRAPACHGLHTARSHACSRGS